MGARHPNEQLITGCLQESPVEISQKTPEISCIIASLVSGFNPSEKY
jgi:hypothetical protein